MGNVRGNWRVMSCLVLAIVSALVIVMPLMATSGEPAQGQRGSVSFPRSLPKEETSRVDRPEWIDASELFTASGTLRRPELAGVMPGAAEMLWRLNRARAAGTYRGASGTTSLEARRDVLLEDGKGGTPDCFEDGIPVMHASSSGPPMPVNIADLEVLAEAIVHGKIVGMRPGFLRGRGVSLYQIQVIEILKGTDKIGNSSSIFLFWPETRLDFGIECVNWSLGGWNIPMPEVCREILLTPLPGDLETIANRTAIVAWHGVEAIYEVDGRLSVLLPPTRFPEVFSVPSIRELEIVRRLSVQRQ